MYLRRLNVVAGHQKFRFHQAFYATSVESINGNSSSVPLGRPFDEIPGPKGLPLVGTYLDYVKPGGFRFEKLFEAIHQRSKDYGPIYKENLGGRVMVVISDIEEYLKIIRIDGKFPVREKLLPIWYYMKVKGMKESIVNTTGQEWWEQRQFISPKLMKPLEILKHVESVDRVASHYLERLPTGFKSKNGPIMSDNGDFVRSDLKETLFLWSLESVGTVLFGTRLGCLEEKPSQFAEKFINFLIGTFEGIQKLMFSLPFYQFYPTKTWREFEKNYTGLLSTGLEILEQNRPKTLSDSPDLMTYFFSQTSDAELINRFSTDILNGSVETTSYSVLWNLYCLSRNERVQEALHQEALKLLPNSDDKVTGDVLNNAKYLKACVKETFRLFPLASPLSRIISANVEVCGYELPAGTNALGNVYSMGLDTKYFPDSDVYRPERWARVNQNSPVFNTLATLPFGHGARMCIGRRLAEMEIYVMLLKFFRKYRIEFIGDNEVKPKLQTLLVPDRPIKFRISPRK